MSMWSSVFSLILLLRCDTSGVSSKVLWFVWISMSASSLWVLGIVLSLSSNCPLPILMESYFMYICIALHSAQRIKLNSVNFWGFFVHSFVFSDALCFIIPAISSPNQFCELQFLFNSVKYPHFVWVPLPCIIVQNVPSERNL